MPSRPGSRALATAILLAASLAACSGAGSASPSAALTLPTSAASAVTSTAGSTATAPSATAALPTVTPSQSAGAPGTTAVPFPSTGITNDLSTIDSLSRSLDGAITDDQAASSQGDTNP